MSFQVKHNLSLFNLNCCLHMLLGVTVQKPLRSIFATCHEEEKEKCRNEACVVGVKCLETLVRNGS